MRIGLGLGAEGLGPWAGLGFLARCLMAAVAALLGYVAFVVLVERCLVTKLWSRGALGEGVAGLAIGGGLFEVGIGWNFMQAG